MAGRRERGSKPDSRVGGAGGFLADGLLSRSKSLVGFCAEAGCDDAGSGKRKVRCDEVNE